MDLRALGSRVAGPVLTSLYQSGRAGGGRLPCLSHWVGLPGAEGTLKYGSFIEGEVISPTYPETRSVYCYLMQTAVQLWILTLSL